MKDLCVRKADFAATQCYQEGDLLMALHHMEVGLLFRRKIHGNDSAEVHGVRVGKLLNEIISCGLAAKERVPSLLHKAELLNRNQPVQLAQTFNMSACYDQVRGAWLQILS